MSATSESTPDVPVPLHDIERELSRQLQTLQRENTSLAHRVRMSNLVVYCDRREQLADITRQLPAITTLHPARVLVLVGERAQKDRPTMATVRVECEASGPHQQACTELVTLFASGGRIDRLPFSVRALLIGDLPVNIWWAASQPPPFATALLSQLAENAQQIVYDSLGWMEPAKGVAATAAWLDEVERPISAGHWRVASDLNWRRLKYWRRSLAHALEPAATPGAADSITELVVEHGPHAVVQAWLAASGLACRFRWTMQAGSISPGVEIAWQLRAGERPVRVRIVRHESGPAELLAIRVVCHIDGQPGAIVLRAESNQRIATTLEGVQRAPRTVTVPPHPLADLIARQLSDRERDLVFRESMRVARRLAQSLLSP